MKVVLDIDRLLREGRITAAEYARLSEFAVEDTGRRLDILVNVAWVGYERMVEDGRFTWPRAVLGVADVAVCNKVRPRFTGARETLM